MKCDLKNRSELVSNYLNGDLSDVDAVEFEAHYFQCEECFSELKLAEEAISLIKKEGRILFKEEKVIRIRSDFLLTKFFTPVRIGFAIVSVILAFIIFLLLQPKNEDQKIVVQKSTEEAVDSSEQIIKESPDEKYIKKETIAELTGPDFEPNAYYEEWMNENIRSVNNLVSEIISPKSGEKIAGSEINFKWRMSDKLIIYLKVFNNTESEIYSEMLDEAEYPEYTIKLKPAIIPKSGLYYWRLEDDSEVLYLNKFYFIKK